MNVESIMKHAQGCREGDSVRDCAKVMKERNVGFVPICDRAGKPVGTLTDRDLAIRVLADGRPPDGKVDDVMTREVISCRLGDDLSSAERLMREHRKSRVMVCEASGKLVGVISLSDIAEVETEAETAQTMREITSRETGQPHAS